MIYSILNTQTQNDSLSRRVHNTITETHYFHVYINIRNILPLEIIACWLANEDHFIFVIYRIIIKNLLYYMFDIYNNLILIKKIIIIYYQILII